MCPERRFGFIPPPVPGSENVVEFDLTTGEEKYDISEVVVRADVGSAKWETPECPFRPPRPILDVFVDGVRCSKPEGVQLSTDPCYIADLEVVPCTVYYDGIGNRDCTYRKTGFRCEGDLTSIKCPGGGLTGRNVKIVARNRRDCDGQVTEIAVRGTKSADQTPSPSPRPSSPSPSSSGSAACAPVACTAAEKKALETERDTLKTERDAAVAAQKALEAERDALKQERDALKTERDALKADLERPCDPNAPIRSRLIAMKGATLSSDFSPSSTPLPYPAENCLVDSGENSSMCVSNSQPNPSWTATTADDQQYDISAVIVRNRADCLGTRAAIRAIVFHKLDSLPVRTKC